MTKTKYLNQRQFQTLNKIGDTYIPGDSQLPSFSQPGCAEHVDTILNSIPKTDLKDLTILLVFLSFFPRSIIQIFCHFLEKGQNLPGAIGTLTRAIRIGLRGIIFTLYYSGKTGKNYEGPNSLEVLGYNVEVFTEDISRANP